MALALTDLSSDCRWPPLAEPYSAALRDAVEFVLASFDVDGIVATGTIVRGNPHASSDLDLYVLHRHPFRQRVQRFFRGVPTEIFVNPPAAVRAYFVEEHASARPITAHMLATGAVVLARSSVVDELRAEAAVWLARPSRPTEAELVRLKYAAATRFEDAADVASVDPATASMLYGDAVVAMLHLQCRLSSGGLPREKDLLASVAEIDSELGVLAARFFSEATFSERKALAEQIADRTLAVRGFFEWDSGPDPVGDG